MTPVPEVLEVLNGTIRTGDTVAVAVRDGNVSAMRVGVVEEFKLRRVGYSDKYVVRVCIRCTHSSDSLYKPVGRVIQVETLDRIAKVSGAEKAPVLSTPAALREYIANTYGGGLPSGTEEAYLSEQ